MLTSAVVRRPGPGFSNGITTSDLGKPDGALTLRQHSDYVQALRACGLAVRILDSDDQYPDCPFIEDTAVVLGNILVITRPGAESRRGEEVRVEEALSSEFEMVRRIEEPGTLDGGDILVMDDRVWIGLTARTNRTGAEQLAGMASSMNMDARLVEIPVGLHLKTFVGSAGSGRVMIDGRLADHPAFRDVERYVVSTREAYAANCREVNGNLILPAGFPDVAEQAGIWGLRPIAVEMSEFRKMDGGVSCLSVIW